MTPDGRVARYFYGIDFPPKELAGRAGAGACRPGRLADRPAAPALLRLRRGDRQVHAVDPAADPRPRAPRPRVALAGFLFVMFRREAKERRMKLSCGDDPAG